ncbi:MAG: alpha-ketoglutarate-dependent dioxygenase AlkB [Alphaproteobacteria bacterium]
MAADSGFQLFPGYLDRAAQEALVEDIRAIARAAPFYQPTMPRSGKPMSVRMTNAGPLGWMTDKQGGYRYQATHPVTGQPWPPIPISVLDIWHALSGYGHDPEACLINHYHGPASKMGLHVDADEQAKDAPVVSISLGASALFRLGGPDRKSPTRSVRLSSGDVVVLAGASRHFYHGIDRLYPETSTLLPSPQRLNITLRRVSAPVSPAS